MSLFLLTGIATLDIINSVSHYPREDEELRASSSQVTAGGNALNTARVLAGQGHRSELLAQLAYDAGSEQILKILDEEGIAHNHCPRSAGTTPTSYITLNTSSGSRTIIHYRDLPELNVAHFRSISLEAFDWLHFEGRNTLETVKMLRHARQRLFDQPISIEIEKPREAIQSIFPMADVLIFSQAYAVAHGYDDGPHFLTSIRPLAPQATLVCAWGEDGAWALARGERTLDKTLHSPARTPTQVVDTLGAGDTFNAGLIASLATGRLLEEALQHAVSLAGRKVGGRGFEHLKETTFQ